MNTFKVYMAILALLSLFCDFLELKKLPIDQRSIKFLFKRNKSEEATQINSIFRIQNNQILNLFDVCLKNHTIDCMGLIKSCLFLTVRVYASFYRSNFKLMGNTKSLYSKQELLHYHIERKDIINIRKMLEINPELANNILTKDTKQTPLIRAAYNGNLQLIKLFLSHKADPNYVTPKGETALTTAVKRSHLEIVQCLIEAKANLSHVSQLGYRVIDYAILGGYYDIARLIFKNLQLKEKQNIQQPEYYEKNAKKYAYRYVNYKQFLQGLVLNTQPQNMPNFLKKDKVKLVDPVVDPRQTWKQWFKRQMEWKDAPLVERSVLPENLQPQNRTFGKVHHYTNNLMSTHLSQKTKLYPSQNHQYMSEMGDVNREQEPTEQKLHEVNEVRSQL